MSARVRWTLLALVTAPLLLWLALAAGVPTPLKGMVERRASAALGRPVVIQGRLGVTLTPWGVDLAAHDVRIANPAWAHDRDLLRAATVGAHRSIFDMLIGRDGFEAVSLRDGMIALERSADGGRTTWPEHMQGAQFDLGRVRVLTANRVQLRYRDDQAGTAAQLSLFSASPGAIVFAGDVRAAGRPFGVAGEVRSAGTGPARLRLAGWGGGDRFGVEGQAARPLGLARSRLYVVAFGRDAAGFAGLAGLNLPQVGDYAVAARALRRDRTWYFTHITGRVARTDLAGSLTLTQRAGRPRVLARLSSHTLNLGDAMLLFGVRDGSASGTGTASPDSAAASSRFLPDATFAPAALQAFDATIDYSAEQVAGLARPAGPLSMHLAMRRGVLVLSPARLAMDGGFVSSDIVVDARRAPVLARYDIRLSPTPMGRLLPGWGVAPAGTTALARGRILLTGHGTTVRETLATAFGRIVLVMPPGELRVQRASESGLDVANLSTAIFAGGDGESSAINCGAIAFTVRNGVGTTDPLLIDTAAHVLSGQGSIGLGDESLNLRLAAGSKHFSLFGRPSPVVVGGTFGSPVVTREATSWLRPATLLGLEFSVPDLRALFRFVDPGDTRPATCPTN